MIFKRFLLNWVKRQRGMIVKSREGVRERSDEEMKGFLEKKTKKDSWASEVIRMGP